MTCEALHNVTWEERRLREYISVMEVALDAMKGEATEAKAIAVATLAELAGELDFVSFEIHSICILMGVVLSFTLLLPWHSGRLVVAQAEVVGL